MLIILSKAIVRGISDSYKKCISDHPNHNKLSIDKTREQHRSYLAILNDLGLEVIIVSQDPESPDCCFIEDNAVVFNNKAVITHMGAEARRTEPGPVAEILKQYFIVDYMKSPATLDGGDVIQVENYLISGISSRTNLEGTRQLSEFLEAEVKSIKDPSIVHLKSYVNYLGDNKMITTPKYQSHPILDPFEKIVIPSDESYAANMININGTIIMAKGFPKSKSIVENFGYDTVIIDTSEFQKCEGALTCLSIRF